MNTFLRLVIRHFTFVILALCASALTAAAQTITTRTLDLGSGPTEDTGRYSSQAVVNGNPAIAYYNNTDSSLIFARSSTADGLGAWTITAVDQAGFVGVFCSLAVIDGNPAISYYDWESDDLKYVRALDASGTSWGIPMTLDSTGDVGEHTSLAVVNGNPAISYYDATNTNLKYVRALDASGINWGTPVPLDTAVNCGQYTSLKIVAGNPAISYYDSSFGDLKYVRATDANGASWGAPVIVDGVAGSSIVGQYTSLAVIDGNPAISYYDSSFGDLKYVRAADASGTNWGTPLTLDSTFHVGFYTSLAVVDGNPAISYYGAGDLKYLRALNASGTSWDTPVSLVSSNASNSTSLMVVNGSPAISYSNGDLKYVRALDASGANWAAAATLDAGAQIGVTGQYTSQAIVNGNPAICYYDNTNGWLKYVRALDASGTSWGTPVTLDSVGVIAPWVFVGSHISLEVVNGNPAISYCSLTNDVLVYVRALDASGTSWGTPVILDGSGVGRYISMEVVNGNPAVSYYDVTNSDLKYVRALDASGTNWGTPVTLDSTGVLGFFSSLAVVDGFPAIGYLTNDPFGSGGIKYVRALDASGTNWGTPVTLDSIGTVGVITNVGFYISMEVVNGNPAISYHDFANDDLKYLRALDSNGTSWGTPVTLDSTGDVGQYASLEVVNGNPAISYYDATNTDLKYLRALDPSGTNWGTPVILDSSGSVGEYTSLAVVDGNAAISYYDQTNGNLKWATYVPPPGVLDAAYDPNVYGGFNDGYVLATVLLPDGRTIIAGNFTIVGGMAHTNVARLNANGRVDDTFTASTNGDVYSVAVQTDGKLVLGGLFTSVNGSAVSNTTGVNCIARLNADGTRDTAFNSSGGVGLGGANSYVLSVAVQTDGKLVLGGKFTSVNGSAVNATTGVNRIARLNVDGSRDTTFNSNGGVGLGGTNNYVYSVAVQADGKLVLGGNFTSVNGSAVNATTGVNRIARLNVDGTRDTAFNNSGGTGLGGANGNVLSVAVQADGKLVLGGSFTSLNGSELSTTTGVNYFARLNADGTRDSAFNPSDGIRYSGATGSIYNVAVQADGNVLLGGIFTIVNGTTRNHIARLTNGTATESLTAVDTTQVLWTRGGTSPEVAQVTFELSTNGGSSYTLLAGTATRVGTTPNWQLTGLSLPTSGKLRARGRSTSGIYNGGSGLVESVVSFSGLTPEQTVQEAWRQQYFGVTTDTGNAADGFDFDNDGLANLLEWACNLNPTTASSLPATANRNGANLEFTYTRSVAALNEGAVFTVEWSDTLAALSWSTAGVSETILSDNGTVQQVKATLPEGSAGRRFVHLKVTAPP